MKIIKSFMNMCTTGVDQLVYRYEEADESGNLTKKDTRGQVLVVDEELKKHVEAIKEYILNHAE